MRALDTKLLRDIGQLRGQVLTIALVVACGIASFIAVRGTYDSIVRARDAYYARYRFADVFAPLKQAPRSLLQRVEDLPGVAVAQARVIEAVSLPVEDTGEPASGLVVGIPVDHAPRLGDIMLREGRLPLPDHSDEVVVLEAFAKAHGLSLGKRLSAVLAGTRRELTVVGLAISPEYVFAMSPGELIPDPRRFGVLWMDRDVVAAAFQKKGAFNELMLRLQPGQAPEPVIDALDRLLAPYGGLGAYDRSHQMSNHILEGELSQLTTMTTMMPAIFLAVAAFLINVVLSRLVQLQRAQIATLKAVGYKNREVGLHDLELAGVIVLLGALVGVLAGVWLGHLMTGVYTQFFHFPNLRFELRTWTLLTGLLCSVGAATVGALSTVRAVMRLPAAEAMRPEPPASYRRSLSERLRVSWLFGQAAHMVLREIERRPLRALMSVVGIALAVALLVMGRFGFDSVDWYMRVQFELAERSDLTVVFRRPAAGRAVAELSRLPGVLRAEGLRTVSVRYRHGHRFRDAALVGYPEQGELRRVLDREGRVMAIPEDGIVLTDTLAQILGVSVGELLTLEVLEGERSTHRVRLAGTVEEVFGLNGHMQAHALSRMLGDEGLVSTALLRVDPLQRGRLRRALRERPEVLGVTRRESTIEMFEQQTAGQMRYTTLILTIFASIIACAVIYNNARITLSTRSRDLASLRVLGFRRAEISAILLGELGLLVAVALLPGCLLGRGLVEAMMAQVDPEMYRFPVVVSARTYSFALLTTIGAALASALLVRRKLDHLDLIGVLKSRE
jgi:putative ABC transport system permease protein